jgi:hypothetical protein
MTIVLGISCINFGGPAFGDDGRCFGPASHAEASGRVPPARVVQPKKPLRRSFPGLQRKRNWGMHYETHILGFAIAALVFCVGLTIPVGLAPGPIPCRDQTVAIPLMD